MVVIIREWMFLVELLHDIRDVAISLLVRPKQLPDPVLPPEASPAAAASRGVAAGTQRIPTRRTAPRGLQRRVDLMALAPVSSCLDVRFLGLLDEHGAFQH